MNFSNQTFTSSASSHLSSQCNSNYSMCPINMYHKSFVKQKSMKNAFIKSSTLHSSLSKDGLTKNTKSSAITKAEMNTARRKFTEEEDKYLTQLVDEMGAKNWDSIAEKMPNRTARQCRDRYSNYLIPGFFNGEWSAEEDENIYKKYLEIGPRWTIIQKYFKNRSPNSLKNRWNYFVSRKDFNVPFIQKPCSNGFDNINYQQFCQQPNIIQYNYDYLNYQPMNYYCCCNQYPSGVATNTNLLANYSHFLTQNEIKPYTAPLIQNDHRNSFSQVPLMNDLKDCEKIQNIDKTINRYTDINNSNESIFQVNFEQKNPGMFDEEIEDYDGNMFNFDESELFNF